MREKKRKKRKVESAKKKKDLSVSLPLSLFSPFYLPGARIHALELAGNARAAALGEAVEEDLIGKS